MTEKTELRGGYFVTCQWCIHDGSCELKHYEFMGKQSSGEVDKSPYPGHEDLAWHLAAFQKNSPRAMCAGRIHATGSIFFPLSCECGTAIDGGFCEKFSPNKKGKQRLALIDRIARKKGIDVSKITNEDLPEPNPSYESVMK